jgi:hypothetical protein
MADRFFDTSATVKHYLPETGTAKVDTLLAETGARHFLSDIGVVELQSVFARQTDGQITAADFGLNDIISSASASSTSGQSEGIWALAWIETDST